MTTTDPRRGPLIAALDAAANTQRISDCLGEDALADIADVVLEALGPRVAAGRRIPGNGPAQLAAVLDEPVADEWTRLHAVLALVDGWRYTLPPDPQDMPAETVRLADLQSFLALSGVAAPSEVDDPWIPGEGRAEHAIRWLADVVSTLRGYRRAHEDEMRALGLAP